MRTKKEKEKEKSIIDLPSANVMVVASSQCGKQERWNDVEDWIFNWKNLHTKIDSFTSNDGE